MTRGGWSAPAALVLVAVAAAWLVAGFGVYLALSGHRVTAASPASRPGEEPAASPALQRLPGTLYLVQAGTLYRLQHGTFRPLLAARGSYTWTMPAVSPDGQRLVVVRRDHAYSDLYLVDAAGHTQAQLTHDASVTTELNHWALYPRLALDGSTLWYSYDPKDQPDGYNVVMSVWSMPLGASTVAARRWTEPNGYTGGDIQPVPLASGGVIYTKYGLETARNRIMAQLWLSGQAGAAGQPLTPADDDCSQPALSPDGRRLAMICTGGKQATSIEVASFDGATLGPRRVIVSGQLAAQPTWAPDGQSLVYLAAQGITGHFQLWQQRTPATPASPTEAPVRNGAAVPAPVQLTTNLDLDATSTIAWHV